MAQTEATRNRIEIVTVIAGFAATIAVGVIGYEYHSLAQRVSDYTERCVALRLEVNANTEHARSHETEASYWKSIIERNRDAVSALRTKPRARADPFTGTDGRKLDQRIHALEDLISNIQPQQTSEK